MMDLSGLFPRGVTHLEKSLDTAWFDLLAEVKSRIPCAFHADAMAEKAMAAAWQGLKDSASTMQVILSDAQFGSLYPVQLQERIFQRFQERVLALEGTVLWLSAIPLAGLTTMHTWTDPFFDGTIHCVCGGTHVELDFRAGWQTREDFEDDPDLFR